MRKVDLDQKSEKSAGAFFDDENHRENAPLDFENSAKVSSFEKENDSAGEHKSSVNLLKQLFVFLPGTFLLFFMSCAAAIIFMEIVVYGRALETLPDDFPLQFAVIGSIVFLGAFMTWFGLGDIKNRKHFAIPASIIISGAAVGAVIKTAAGISDFPVSFSFDYSGFDKRHC